MSRSNPVHEDENQPTRYYIGKDKPNIEYTTDEQLHWYQAYLMGYRAKAWPKGDADRDDIRYDLKEKEEQL